MIEPRDVDTGEVNLAMQPGPSGRAAVTVMLDGKPIGDRGGGRRLETVFDRGCLYTSAGAIASMIALAAYAGPALWRWPASVATMEVRTAISETAGDLTASAPIGVIASY